MKKETYNGWSNYATWRVNLEIIDGYEFVKEDITSSEDKLSINDIADFLRDNVVENAITQYGEMREPSLALDYARAIISEVNFYEIAETVAENCPSLLE
jgi:hypothetical protein